jgi:predicted transcriptional regulator
MPAKTTKDRIIETLRDLPADASFEDAIERIVFLAKVEEGLSQLDSGRAIPHQEVRRRLGR